VPNEHAALPALYIPHGGGPAFFMSGGMGAMFQPMAEFLATIASRITPTPRAILVVTAHWEADVATVTSGPSPHLVYDYYGFPEETYALTYPAKGAPDLAARIVSLLEAEEVAVRADPAYGFDHGVFIPLKVMYPAASIPVVAMSLVSGLDPETHARIGSALAPLRREGVLIVGSGMSYHNMRPFPGAGAAAAAFDQWLDEALAGDAMGRRVALARWSDAPSARDAHPREEHLLPLMVVSAAGSDAPARRIWRGTVGGARVSAWAFD
jgi:aromatic ring-opening dioxygenase catalytic subunit (LigB family)